MKKVVLLFILSLFCFSGLAQTPHLNFMGLSMNERLETFMQKLRNMGFVGEYEEDSFGGAVLTEMKGSYRNKPVKLSFNMTPKSKLVCEVHMSLDKPNVTEAEARTVFNAWKSLVPNPGPLLKRDNQRTHEYTEWLLSRINTDIGQVSLDFGYTKKGGIKKDIYVRIDFNDTQNFAKLMDEESGKTDEGNQVDNNIEKPQTSQFEKEEIIIPEPFPPGKVIGIISTFTPKREGREEGNGDGNSQKAVYPPSPKPSGPKPGPVPPNPKPHHWGQIKVETDTTDVLIDINAIDFIRQLFLTNNYNEVKQLIMSTPSLAFKITEEKKNHIIASRTEGECEELWLSRSDKKSNNIDVLRITVKQWDEDEIIKYLTAMGYKETSQKQEDILGNPAITRTYSNGDTSHIVEFFFLKRTDPIKSILFKRK